MRVNVIKPELLADQHLRAEYNEIYGMMIVYYRRSFLERKQPFDESKIPLEYTLNKGHATFFYDKMKFVQNRWYEVKEECSRRGYVTKLNELNYSIVKERHMNDYVPTYEARLVNLERILTRIYTKIFIQNKPNFYTLRRQRMTFQDWCDFYVKNEGIKQEDIDRIVKSL